MFLEAAWRASRFSKAAKTQFSLSRVGGPTSHQKPRKQIGKSHVGFLNSGFLDFGLKILEFSALYFWMLELWIWDVCILGFPEFVFADSGFVHLGYLNVVFPIVGRVEFGCMDWSSGGLDFRTLTFAVWTSVHGNSEFGICKLFFVGVCDFNFRPCLL